MAPSRGWFSIRSVSGAGWYKLSVVCQRETIFRKHYSLHTGSQNPNIFCNHLSYVKVLFDMTEGSDVRFFTSYPSVAISTRKIKRLPAWYRQSSSGSLIAISTVGRACKELSFLHNLGAMTLHGEGPGV